MNTSANPTGGGSDWLQPGFKNAQLVYFLYLLGFVLGGIPSIIGLVLAYMNRGKADAAAASHYTYQIRTFWIGLLYGLISFILMAVLIGGLLMIAVAIWVIVRCVKGLMAAGQSDAIAAPNNWLV